MADDLYLPFAFPGQRLGILIDTTDLYHAARVRFGGRLDYRLLLERIVARRVLVRAVAFVVRADEVDMRPFIDALVEAGITARVKRVPRLPEGSPRGGWEVGIALAAAELCGRVDALALVSGSEALAEVAEHVRGRGVCCEVYAVDGHLAPQLAHGCDFWRVMGEDWLLPGRRRRPSTGFADLDDDDAADPTADPG